MKTLRRLLFGLIILSALIGASTFADPTYRPPPKRETALVPKRSEKPSFLQIRRIRKRNRRLHRRFRMGVGSLADYFGFNLLMNPAVEVFLKNSLVADFLTYFYPLRHSGEKGWSDFRLGRFEAVLDRIDDGRSFDEIEILIQSTARQIGEEVRRVGLEAVPSHEDIRRFEGLFFELEVAILLYQEVGRRSGYAAQVVQSELKKRPRFWRWLRTIRLMRPVGQPRMEDTSYENLEDRDQKRWKEGLGVDVKENVGIRLLYIGGLAMSGPLPVGLYSAVVAGLFLNTRTQEKEHLASQFLDRIARFAAKEALEEVFSVEELPVLDEFLMKLEVQFFWNDPNGKRPLRRALCVSDLT